MPTMTITHVISLGGSIVVPDSVDADYLVRFRACLSEYLQENEDARVVLVVGGGAPARSYQAACRTVRPDVDNDTLDWIGVAATRLNATLLRHVFGDLCRDEVVTDPSRPGTFSGRVLVGSGWKPGFSTDFDAILLAEHFGATVVYNLSNITHVYDSDPRYDPHARPYEVLSWAEFRRLVGDEWKPGGNAPFDPVAAKRAQEAGIGVVVANGRDLANLASLLRGGPVTGTRIGLPPGP